MDAIDTELMADIGPLEPDLKKTQSYTPPPSTETPPSLSFDNPSTQHAQQPLPTDEPGSPLATSPFEPPSQETPPRVNGNRPPNLDTSGASTLSTADENGSSSSSSSSDSEDDRGNVTTLNEELDEEDVDVELDGDLNRDHPPQPMPTTSHLVHSFETDEYPDDDDEEEDDDDADDLDISDDDEEVILSQENEYDAQLFAEALQSNGEDTGPTVCEEVDREISENTSAPDQLHEHPVDASDVEGTIVNTPSQEEIQEINAESEVEVREQTELTITNDLTISEASDNAIEANNSEVDVAKPLSEVSEHVLDPHKHSDDNISEETNCESDVNPIQTASQSYEDADQMDSQRSEDDDEVGSKDSQELAQSSKNTEIENVAHPDDSNTLWSASLESEPTLEEPLGNDGLPSNELRDGGQEDTDKLDNYDMDSEPINEEPLVNDVSQSNELHDGDVYALKEQPDELNNDDMDSEATHEEPLVNDGPKTNELSDVNVYASKEDPGELDNDDMDIEPYVNTQIQSFELDTEPNIGLGVEQDNDHVSDVYMEDIEPSAAQQELGNEEEHIQGNDDQDTIGEESDEAPSEDQSEPKHHEAELRSSGDNDVMSDEYVEDSQPSVTDQPELSEERHEAEHRSSGDNDEGSDGYVDDIEPAVVDQPELTEDEHNIRSSDEQETTESDYQDANGDEYHKNNQAESDAYVDDIEPSIQNSSALEEAAFGNCNGSEVVDMDLEEPNPSTVVQDHRILSIPVSTSEQKVLQHPNLNPAASKSTFVPNKVPEYIRKQPPSQIERHPLHAMQPSLLSNTRRLSSCSSAVNQLAGELPEMLMSPPSFKSTDEMKYYLKHQLQYSDMGKLFGNVDDSSGMGSGQGSDYAQYLGLQPSLKFRCFKCSESNFVSLAELKQHQITCLKAISNATGRSVHSPRGSSTVGLRSSLNSDNAMDVDLSENTAAKSVALRPSGPARSIADSCQSESKIRLTRKVYLCSACGTYYENWNLFLHMREVHQKFICLLCLGIFPSAEKLVHHLEGKHNSRPDVYEHKDHLLSTLKDQCYMMCTVCEHIFTEHDNFTSHSCENYIKPCALCGLKFIHKPQCIAGATNKSMARKRRDKNKQGKHRQKKLAPDAPNNALGIGNSIAHEPIEPSGLNFSNALFGGTSSSINGMLGGSFELPQSILSNQIPDDPVDSYVVPQLAPEAPLPYLPQKLLQDDKPQEYPTNSSSSSMSSSSYVQPITNNASTAANQQRSAGKIWPPLNNGYMDPQESMKPTNINNNSHQHAQSATSQANVPSIVAPPANMMSSGKNISLFDHHHRESISIGEDYLDNRDMEIINSYISDFDTFSQGGQGKNVSLTDIEPMQPIKSPTPPPTTHEVPEPIPQEPPPIATTEPPRLVPKLKLNLSKAFQTPIESEESSTESDEEEDEEDEEDDDEPEAAEEEAEDEEDEPDEVKQADEERFKQASKFYQTPSNASRTPHPMSPHSFAAPSIPPPTPPHLHRSIADSDIQIDVERTSDMAVDDTHDEEEETSIVPSHHSHDFPSHAANDPESEDVNIEDEDKDSQTDAPDAVEEPQPVAQPLVPFDGIHLADDDIQITELLLSQPFDRVPIQEFLRICIKATFPHCLYCNHARKIAVEGHHLARHMLAHHRFNATVDSITAEELLPITIIQRIKSHLDELSNIYFNLDTFNTADPANNIISPKSFECFQCRFQARHHKDLYLHNRKMHLKTVVVCLMCKANFYSFSELSGHLCPGHPRSHDQLDVHFRCVLCNLDRIPSAFRLMVHLRKKHGACDICLEFCDDQSRLSSHVCKHKLHHLCYRCGISYRNKADITKHLFWKHGTESQLCKKCMQKKWPHVYHFCVPPATFVCEVCSTSFKRAVALKVHKRLHTEDHPYPCTEDGCEKRFISRKLLLKHVARHYAVEEPEEPKPDPTIVQPAIVEDIKPDVDAKPETKTELPEVDKKPIPPKPLIDIIKDLPAPNLSESDSSDESDSDQRSRPASRMVLPKAPVDAAAPDDDEQQSAPIADIWDNFRSYQANQKQSLADEDREHDPPPPPLLHVSQSDHDYCNMYVRAPVPVAKKPDPFIPLMEIKQEPIDEDEVAAQRSPIAKPQKVVESKGNKSPKKGRSPKKALDKSGSDSSSSDSDSSCSCGSNCSCTSGSSSDGSSSSSSSSSGDSSSSEGRRKKAAKLAKRRPSQQSPAKVTAKEEASENIDVGVEVKKTTPSNDPDLIILESDLDTDESETDEEFYDEHPLRMANQILAEKRKLLMEQTSMNPLGSFDIVENSRPSTPSLPPAEEELKSRKQKGKKRKKDRKNSKCVPSLKLNLSTQSVSVIPETHVDRPAPMVYPNLIQPAPQPPASVMETNLSRFTSNFPEQSIRTQNKPRLSTGSSCSDVDSSLKRSKRRRIPNKFYGYTSDEDTPAANIPMTPQDAFKPQPPPNLTWNKEDLPQTPTVIRTPPIKTIIKLPTGHNSFSRTSSIEYPTIASPQPPALPSRNTQPPIPPIIIRPNRVIQPALVEPLRVPAVPVHHIAPASNPETEADSDSSDSDSSNDGHLQIQQTPTPTAVPHTPQPFSRMITTPLRATPAHLATKTPKPRSSAARKRPAPKFISTPKTKRAKNEYVPKTPAIPAQYLPFLDPEPTPPASQPRSMTTHIPISAVANQIRYPIMPPAGSRPARAGESVYCYCRCPYDEVSEMIACDGDDCPIEWFHFECVNIMVPPKGTWYCPQCRPKYVNDDDDDLATN